MSNSATTTADGLDPDTPMPPVHPGETLREEFLEPLHMSADQLVAKIGVTASRLQDVVDERSSLDAELSLRLARYFGMSERFWMNLQAHYDLEVAHDMYGKQILAEVTPLRSPA